jgi:uncharacterized membrane protein
MKKDNLLPLLFLIILAVIFRTAWHFGDNIEFVTSATLIASAYFGLKGGLLVPFTAMFISDVMIGNTNIFIFTWSAYLIIGVLGYRALGRKNKKFKKKNDSLKIKGIIVIKAMGMGIVASLWFYLWTNFGVWVLDSWGMYPKTIHGLIEAYIMGLPFLKANLIGNIILVSFSFIFIESFRLLWRNSESIFRNIKHSTDV